MQREVVSTIANDKSGAAVLSPLAATVIDAAVLCLCNYETLMKLVDFKKVRTMLEREAERAGDGCVHLTPLFVYLWAQARPWFATGDVMACVREISAALQQRGVKARLPDAYRFPAKPREATPAPEPRVAVGTRAGDRRRRAPRPVRHE